jgi:hypothetical protein
MAGDEADGVLSIEQVLAAEARAIHGVSWGLEDLYAPRIRGQDAQDERARLNADRHELGDIPDKEVERREALYRALNKLNSAALCCSGGGIRSATFCLGVIQTLAKYDVKREEAPKPRIIEHKHEEQQKQNLELERQTFVSATLHHTTSEMVLELQKRRPEQNHPEQIKPAEAAFPPLQKRAPAQEQPKKPEKLQPINPENSLLGRFHYLSTVSGGGYVGSWLSSWRARDPFDTIIHNLTGRPQGADIEPPEISWLRAYSNYLTPRIGIASADSWAAVAIVVRNLVLNWLVIIPVVCLVLLTLKVIATGGVWIAHVGENDWFGDGLRHWPIILTLVIGVVCLIAAQAFTTRHRPPRRLEDADEPPPAATTVEHEKSAADPGIRGEEKAGETEKAAQSQQARAEQKSGAAHVSKTEKVGDGAVEPKAKCLLCRRIDLPENCCLYRRGNAPRGPTWCRSNVDDTCFIVRDLVWAGVSAIAITIFFTSRYFFSWYGDLSPLLEPVGLTPKIGIPAVTALGSFVIYSLGWVAGCRLGPKWRSDYFYWAISGLIYGALVGFGAYLFTLLRPYASCACSTSGNLASLLTAMIFGVPWVLMAQLTADNIFGGFVSYEPKSDSDREWLGRAAGWLSAFAIAWAIVAFLVFAAGYFVQDGVAYLKQTIVASGGVVGVVSGIATALLGSSSKTPAKSGSGDQSNISAIAFNIALAVAGPIFATVLIVALSIALDKLLLGDSLVTLLLASKPQIGFIFIWLIIGGVIAYLIARIASRCVNINRFSLHALYRNRLTRGYLGASRQQRHPDSFTGFASGDNIRMWQLWPPMPGGKVESKSLFHVVNIALNVVSTKRLAWQERKAEAFTVSPLHSGSAYVGFRCSKHYGDSLPPITNREKQGIALGTAMAISGAAVSSNMGYHSSPSLALLLTLFNVRLGWWLGNPGEPGNKDQAYRREGPRVAAKPLFYEAFGQTTDTSAYVYLSDGGHFENLGLYEMVRRRCRFIIVIDAGCDPDFTFEDLGNAVRKIYIDLGVRITFEGLDKLRNRPSDDEIKSAGNRGIPHHALGTIHYVEADGKVGKDAECEDGTVLYIKPAYHGTIEGAGVRSYAMANKDFPHETTVDQWFTESQFESYRSLGMDITNDILGHEIVLKKEPTKVTTLHDVLKALPTPL